MKEITITKSNFEAEVIASPIPVMIDFWAEWCGPCKQLLPVIAELAATVTTAKICKINVDTEEDLAKQFGVMSIPTLIFFSKGKEVNRIVGARSKQELLNIIAKL